MWPIKKKSPLPPLPLTKLYIFFYSLFFHTTLMLHKTSNPWFLGTSRCFCYSVKYTPITLGLSVRKSVTNGMSVKECKTCGAVYCVWTNICICGLTLFGNLLQLKCNWVWWKFERKFTLKYFTFSVTRPLNIIKMFAKSPINIQFQNALISKCQKLCIYVSSIISLVETLGDTTPKSSSILDLSENSVK